MPKQLASPKTENSRDYLFTAGTIGYSIDMEYLTTKQIADDLQISPQRVTGLIRAGELKAQPVKVGTYYVVLKKDFERFKRKPRRGPGRPAEAKRKRAGK
jgi:hypothetical protein